MKVHFILQGKGGVGKSVISALLAQYKIEKGESVTCLDTDPQNATFHGYKSLNVDYIDLLDGGDEINPRHFDKIIEVIANNENDIIIDNGASSFINLSSYIVSNDVPSVLSDLGRQIVIHTVITGGQALADTVNGFYSLITQFPENVTFVLWLNPYWGEIVGNSGQPFEELKVYQDNKHKISALIKLPELRKETHGQDFSNMLKDKKTFNEALAPSSTLSIMVKQRLKSIKSNIFKSLDSVSGVI